MRYGDSKLEERLRQVERDIDDCESDIGDTDKNLDVINEHNSDYKIKI